MLFWMNSICPSPVFPVLWTMISNVPWKKVNFTYWPYETIKRTSSSRSKKATPLASFIFSRLSIPFLETTQPLLPFPPGEHPAAPGVLQSTDNTSLGTRSLAEGEPVIMRKSGKPSRLASPSLRGRGNGGLKLVSSTKSWVVDFEVPGVEGISAETGKRTNNYGAGSVFSFNKNHV